MIDRPNQEEEPDMGSVVPVRDRTRCVDIAIIMNGVTGRMGTNQHLIRSILAIVSLGGVLLPQTQQIINPIPILIGRSLPNLHDLASTHDVPLTSCHLLSCLPSLLKSTLAIHPNTTIYFDAQLTALRFDSVKLAIEAGAHVYAEKPLASTSAQALQLHRLANAKGVKVGVVQDKLFLPGPLKLRGLLDSGFFGEVLSVRGEFGYWVFSGHAPDTVGKSRQAPQRPSWNYRAEEGGGIISDMLCHWQYLLEGLFDRPIRSLSCIGATHVKRRVDEDGQEYDVTADDSAYAMFELDGGIVAQFNSSWATRVRRDDLLTLQVDGTKGSAVVGLRQCWTQNAERTPKVVWNPDIKPEVDYWDGWERTGAAGDAGGQEEFENAFKAQWVLFLKHVVDGRQPWKHNFMAGARGVAVTEAGVKSWQRRQWIDIPSDAVS